MKPTFFDTPEAFREWLDAHHETEKELIVGFYKKATGIPSITWPESVDEALCYGWIDGIRRRIDKQAYSIRFTPRRPDSIWSAVNIRRVKELIEEGRMQPSGLEAFKKRDEKRAKRYSYERNNASLPGEYKAMLKENSKAWKYWQDLPPSIRKQCAWWVTSAKRQSTQDRRMRILLESCVAEQRIPPLRYGRSK